MSRAGPRQWRPPTHAESCACLQREIRVPQQCRTCTPEPVLVTAARSGLYEAKAVPSNGDWLADGSPGEVDRGGQSIEQWRRNHWPQRLPLPTGARRRRSDAACKIYLVPLGDSAAKLKTDALCDGVRAFFYGAKVELLPWVSSKKLRAQVQSHKSATGVQFETFGCQKLLTRLMPADAFVVIGITSDELYKDTCSGAIGEGPSVYVIDTTGCHHRPRG